MDIPGIQEIISTEAPIIYNKSPGKSSNSYFSKSSRDELEGRMRDPVFFSEEILGYKLPTHQQDWLRLGLEQIKNKENMLFLAPADHGKSFVFSHILPLYLICMDRNIRIILASGIDSAAEDFSESIGTQLESNEMLLELFGEFKVSGRWSRSKKFVVRPRYYEKDPTIKACGIFSNVKNSRSDILLCDDLVTLKNSQAFGYRERVSGFFWQILMNTMEPWGTCIINGTREHDEDLYDDIIKTGQFKNIILKAMIDEEAGEVLWPERWPLEVLQERRSKNLVAYLKRFENTLRKLDLNSEEARRAVESSKDKNAVLVNGLNPEERNKYSKVYCSLDPNLSKGGKKSRTVLTTMGFIGDVRHVLNIQRKTYATSEWNLLVDMVDKEVSSFRPDKVFVETNSFGGLLGQHIREKGIPVVGLWTGNSKNDIERGIPALYPLIANGLAKFPYGDRKSQIATDIFLGEVLGWPNCEYQDCVMTWYFIEKGIRVPKPPSKPAMSRKVNMLSKFQRRNYT